MDIQTVAVIAAAVLAGLVLIRKGVRAAKGGGGCGCGCEGGGCPARPERKK